MGRALGVYAFGLLGVAAAIAQTATSTQTAAAPAPAAHARMTLDVVVKDRAGKPVGALEPPQFKILDNGQPRKVLAFRRTDGTTGSSAEPPVQVILLVDVVDMPYKAVSFQRLEVDKFLRSNGGHLAHPTSLFILNSKGLNVQPEPSRDGNAIADELAKAGTVRAMDASSGYAGALEQFDRATMTLLGIADNEAHKPGRKILIWIGHGWPLLQGPVWHQTNESRQTLFRTIMNLQNKLREGRVTVYGLFTLVGENARGIWEGHLKPVTDPRAADPADLALQVIALHSGGRILDPTNDVAGQIANCTTDIGPYYTLLFEPGPSTGPNEFHTLAVQVDQPDLTARTNSGYYTAATPAP